MDETLLISGFRECLETYLKANVTFALTSFGSVMQGRAQFKKIKEMGVIHLAASPQRCFVPQASLFQTSLSRGR